MKTALLYFSGLSSCYMVFKYSQYNMLKLPNIFINEIISDFKNVDVNDKDKCSKYKKAMESIDHFKLSMILNDSIIKQDFIFEKISEIQKHDEENKKLKEDISKFYDLYSKYC